ncbi:hypothetical protein C2I17_17405 [Niallia circulans]|uniref:hypothetical protein n=1 Tax=Niallia circulans TaxID=1397 RepID=UPI00201E0BF8|nr:hypothetical protein [Niallia circulans]UQZ76191.1 hypothetical protein C2I17_17405 [Niallia circulans]
MINLKNTSIKKDDIINFELNHNLSFYTSKILYDEFGIIFELIKKHENETDFFSILFKDKHGYYKAVLDYGENLIEKDILYYINELLEFIQWGKGESLVIKELIDLWSQIDTLIPYDEIDDPISNRLMVIGMDIIFSITEMYFMLMKRDKQLTVKERKTVDTRGRVVTVNLASYTRESIL